MSNIADCIQRAVDARELNQVKGQAAIDQYHQLVARYETIMPARQAEAAAAADLKEATRKAARSRFHTVVNQLQAMRRLQHQINAAPDPALALRNLLEWSDGTGATGESVKSLTDAYVTSINAGISEFLKKAGLGIMGATKDRALLEDVLEVLHGGVSASKLATRLAKAIVYQQKRMVQMFNAHGGDIPWLEGYGIRHSHSPEMLRREGFDAWAGEIEQRLDWSKITDHATGKPFAAQSGQVPPRSVTNAMLRDVYEGITTRGWDDRAAALSTGGAALYNRRRDHRELHFKSGRDWISYNKRFGGSDPFSAMMSGLHGLARDVAMMRVLGPNPKAGLEFAIQTATKRAMTAGDAAMQDAVAKKAGLVRTMYAHVSGSANIPEDAFWASFFSGTRAIATSINLGSAVLSASSDMVTIATAARNMGMNPGNVAARTAKLIASQSTRQTAARMGYVAQTLAEAGGGSSRYFGQLFGNGIPERLSGFTLRASGLTFVTDMRRIAFQSEFAGFLAEHAEVPFSELPEELRRAFAKRDIGPRDWDLLRDPAARFVTDDGADFISPMWWLEHQSSVPRAEAEGLAMRLQMLVQEQLELAVPSASIEGRARLQGSFAPGTIPGELARSFMSYKSFAMSLMLNQYRAFMAQPTPLAKGKYAALLLVPLLMTGALAIQLKELAKGNDPRPMTDAKFWLAALLQSGGLGIFGDFFAAEQSRIGGGLAETATGPVVSLIGDVIGPVVRNVTAVVEGKDTSIGRDVATTVRMNTPVGSSLWYARLAFDRIVADSLQEFLDPEAADAFRRQMKRRETEYGTRSWWRRGALAPFRAPDLSNIGAKK